MNIEGFAMNNFGNILNGVFVWDNYTPEVFTLNSKKKNSSKGVIFKNEVYSINSGKWFWSCMGNQAKSTHPKKNSSNIVSLMRNHDLRQQIAGENCSVRVIVGLR